MENVTSSYLNLLQMKREFGDSLQLCETLMAEKVCTDYPFVYTCFTHEHFYSLKSFISPCVWLTGNGLR